MNNHLDEIIEEVEKFKHNIFESSKFLEALNKINTDYREAIDEPKNLVCKVNDLISQLESQNKYILNEINLLLQIVRNYDSLIENKVDTSIKNNLDTINNVNIELLNLIKKDVGDHQSYINKYNESVENQHDIFEGLIGNCEKTIEQYRLYTNDIFTKYDLQIFEYFKDLKDKFDSTTNKNITSLTEFKFVMEKTNKENINSIQKFKEDYENYSKQYLNSLEIMQDEILNKIDSLKEKDKFNEKLNRRISIALVFSILSFISALINLFI